MSTKTSAPAEMEGIIEAFDEISGLCRHLRQGGPVPEDLQELSDALHEAVGIAANMLHTLAQQPAPSAPVGVKTLSEFMAEQEALHPGIHDKVQSAADELRASLTQQPAYVKRQPEAWITPGGDVSRSFHWCLDRCLPDQYPRPLYAAQQSAAVDEAMVERAWVAFCESAGSARQGIRAALTAALATKRQEPTT